MKIKFFQSETITRQDDTPYLWRLRIIETPWFGLYLHRFLSSDDPCLHDHPWFFVSLILWGGYWETAIRDGLATRRWYWPGSILFRRAAWSHRIEVPRPGWTWTLVFRGRRSRPWGFWTTRFGWIPWQRFKHQDHCAGG